MIRGIRGVLFILFAVLLQQPAEASHYLGHGQNSQPSAKQIDEFCKKKYPEIKQSPQYGLKEKQEAEKLFKKYCTAKPAPVKPDEPDQAAGRIDRIEGPSCVAPGAEIRVRGSDLRNGELVCRLESQGRRSALNAYSRTDQEYRFRLDSELAQMPGPDYRVECEVRGGRDVGRFKGCPAAEMPEAQDALTGVDLVPELTPIAPRAGEPQTVEVSIVNRGRSGAGNQRYSLVLALVNRDLTRQAARIMSRGLTPTSGEVLAHKRQWVMRVPERGRGEQVSVVMNIPGRLSDQGSLYWCAFVDSDQQIAELDERNNLDCVPAGGSQQTVERDDLSKLFGSAVRNQDNPGMQVDPDRLRENLLPAGATPAVLEMVLKVNDSFGLPPVHVDAAGPLTVSWQPLPADIAGDPVTGIQVRFRRGSDFTPGDCAGGPGTWGSDLPVSESIVREPGGSRSFIVDVNQTDGSGARVFQSGGTYFVKGCLLVERGGTDQFVDHTDTNTNVVEMTYGGTVVVVTAIGAEATFIPGPGTLPLRFENPERHEALSSFIYKVDTSSFFMTYLTPTGNPYGEGQRYEEIPADEALYSRAVIINTDRSVVASACDVAGDERPRSEGSGGTGVGNPRLIMRSSAFTPGTINYMRVCVSTRKDGEVAWRYRSRTIGIAYQVAPLDLVLSGVTVSGSDATVQVEVSVANYAEWARMHREAGTSTPWYPDIELCMELDYGVVSGPESMSCGLGRTISGWRVNVDDSGIHRLTLPADDVLPRDSHDHVLIAKAMPVDTETRYDRDATNNRWQGVVQHPDPGTVTAVTTVAATVEAPIRRLETTTCDAGYFDSSTYPYGTYCTSNIYDCAPGGTPGPGCPQIGQRVDKDHCGSAPDGVTCGSETGVNRWFAIRSCAEGACLTESVQYFWRSSRETRRCTPPSADIFCDGSTTATTHSARSIERGDQVETTTTSCNASGECSTSSEWVSADGVTRRTVFTCPQDVVTDGNFSHESDGCRLLERGNVEYRDPVPEHGLRIHYRWYENAAGTEYRNLWGRGCDIHVTLRNYQDHCESWDISRLNCDTGGDYCESRRIQPVPGPLQHCRLADNLATFCEDVVEHL